MGWTRIVHSPLSDEETEAQLYWEPVSGRNKSSQMPKFRGLNTGGKEDGKDGFMADMKDECTGRTEER